MGTRRVVGGTLRHVNALGPLSVLARDLGHQFGNYLLRVAHQLIDLVIKRLVVAFAFAAQVVLPVVTGVAQDMLRVQQLEPRVALLNNIDA